MKNKLVLSFTMVFFLVFFVWNLIGEKSVYSESERRKLEKFPDVTIETILDGEFADGLEDYAVDHFPLRDGWRSIKAYTKTLLLRQKDNNGLYFAEKHLAKIEYPMNEKMLDHAIDVFDNIEIPDESKAYLTVIPDKNRYLAQKQGYLSLDYDALSTYMATRMPWAKYIEIADLLEVDDYYYTDTHWRQEKIVDVAEHLVNHMDGEMDVSAAEYNKIDADILFSGVYAGQSALKVNPDKVYYLTNETIDTMTVEGANAIYDMEKAAGRDAYEMFLSGNQPIITIKNPSNSNGKRLILFRDSFGSSIAPLLAQKYSETLLIDLRYVSSGQVNELVEFKDADILFMLSTLLLNNSLALK